MSKDSYTLGQVRMHQPGGPRFANAMEKPKDFKQSWLRLLSYAKEYKVQIVIILVLAVSSVAFSLFSPNKIRIITNSISDGIKSGYLDLPGIYRTGILVALFYFISAAASYVQNYMTTRTSTGIAYRLRRDISEKINRISLSKLDQTSFGDLLSRVTNDVDTVGESLSHSAVHLIRGITTFIFCTAAMLLTNVLLTVIAVSSSLIGFYLMNLIIKKSQKYFSLRQRYLGDLNGHIEEMYAGHIIVKAYNGEKSSFERFAELNKGLQDNNFKSQFISGIMMPLMDLVGNLGYLMVCVFGAMLTIRGMIDFGTIVAFIIYVKTFTQPLGMIAQAITSLQSAAAASERIFAFLGEEEMPSEDEKIKDFKATKGEVVFDHVHFGYVPEKTIIKDFSFTAKPGMKVAIVGPTGAGKTTLVNLLMRFYETDSGDIYVDGVNTKSMTRENVRDLFSMVLQDTWIFEGTIRDNLTYGNPNATDEEIDAVCRLTGIYRYIHSLQDGYDTVINDEFQMSSGQKQLLTISRAMIADRALLIMDEATSSVDSRTEKLIQNAMEKLTEGRTTFTIAHRLSTIVNADVILVMNDGNIVEQGSHSQLIAKNGFYAELWNSQYNNN